MKITMEMSKGAYEISKKVYSGQLTRTEGKTRISDTTGMNEGSAQAFITIFLAMMNGEVYKRAFNNDTNRFLLESIREDYGEISFRNALKAVQKHIDYYSTLGRGNLTGLQAIVNQMDKHKSDTIKQTNQRNVEVASRTSQHKTEKTSAIKSLFKRLQSKDIF